MALPLFLRGALSLGSKAYKAAKPFVQRKFGQGIGGIKTGADKARPYVKTASDKVSDYYGRAQRLPVVGTRTPDPSGGIRSSALYRGAGYDAGLGVLEGAAVLDTLQDPNATAVDYGIAALYGFGGAGLGLRSARQFRSLRRGERQMVADTPFTRRAGQATVAGVGADVLFGGPSEAKPIQMASPVTPEAEEAARSKMSVEEQQIIDQFFQDYPGGKKSAPRNVVNALNEALNEAYERRIKDNTIPKQKEDTVITGDSKDKPLTKNKQIQKENFANELQKTNPNPTVQIDTEAQSGEPLEKVLQETNKAAGNVVANTTVNNDPQSPLYGEIMPGPVADMFDRLYQKKQFYSKTQKAIDDYKKLIETQAGKKKTFEEYQAQYDKMTGTKNDEQLKNVTMLKWGLSLMQGTSNQGGLAGALDAVAKASVPFANDLQAIAAQEKAENTALANMYMQYEREVDQQLDAGEKQAYQFAIDAASKIESAEIKRDSDFLSMNADLMKHTMTIRANAAKAHREANKIKDKVITRAVANPMATGGIENKEIYETVNGEYRQKIYNPATQNTEYVRISEEEFNRLEAGQSTVYNANQVAKAHAKMSSANVGFQYINRVNEMVEGGQRLGLRASISRFVINGKSIVNDLIGLTGETSPYAIAGYEYDVQNGNADAAVNKIIMSQYEGATDKEKEELDKVRAMYNKGMQEANTKAGILLSGKGKQFEEIMNKVDPDGELSGQDKITTAQNIAELIIIEQRMKYILANANKGADRLALKDVENAAKATSIFGLQGTTQTLNAYNKLSVELANSFKSAHNLYVQNGGQDRGLDIYTAAPMIIARNKKRQSQTIVDQAEGKNVTDNLLQNFYGN